MRKSAGKVRVPGQRHIKNDNAAGRGADKTKKRNALANSLGDLDFLASAIFLLWKRRVKGRGKEGPKDGLSGGWRKRKDADEKEFLYARAGTAGPKVPNRSESVGRAAHSDQ